MDEVVLTVLVKWHRQVRIVSRNVPQAPDESYSRMTLDDLTVNFSHIDRESLLADWVWLIGESKLPILLTASGDAFVQDVKTGSVHVLDVAAGSLSEVASSLVEFQLLLSNKEFVVSYFAVEMVGDLFQSGQMLKAGQIFSFKIPPVLGGEYVLGNIEATDVEVHFSLAGQLHKKVSKLPPGTKINSITIN